MLLEDFVGNGERRVRLPIISGSSFGLLLLARFGVSLISAGLSPFSPSGLLTLNDSSSPSRVDSSFHAFSNRSVNM